MASHKNDKGKFLILGAVVVVALALVFQKVYRLQIQGNNTNPPSPKPQLIRQGVVSDSTSKQVMLGGCGPSLLNYQYSIVIPNSWTINKRETEFSDYYDLTNASQHFTVACTSQGVGGGLCDDQTKVTKFKVVDKVYETCFSSQNGTSVMSVLNLDTDPATNATIGFWAEGIQLDYLKQLLLTFRIESKK